MMHWDHPEARALIELALREDIGTGDITSAATIPAYPMAHRRFFRRQEGRPGGVELLPIHYEMDGSVDEFILISKRGEFLQPGHARGGVWGRAQTLLECERVALNF